MSILSVPFVKQNYNNSCGAAALEMVYKYNGLKDVSQEEIFNKSEKFDLGNGNYILKEETLVLDAKSRGFFSEIFQASFSDIKDGVEFLTSFIKHKIPLIVCQQWKKNSGIGHFRVVIGIDENFVYFQDSNIEKGLEYLKWKHKKFFDHWETDGKMVLGNTCIIVTEKGLKLPFIVQEALKDLENKTIS